MSENPVLALVDQQDWLQPIQDVGEKVVKDAFAAAGPAGQSVKNLLHGVPIGHPLHSAITDVPVGSWTAAAVLDVLEASGHQQYAAGADAAVVVGLVGAAGAALSGLTDWSETHGKPQRLGALHGLLNIAATLLYGTSYALRKTGQRTAGRSLSFAGYGLVMASAWLGGALSYTQKIGVNHAPDESEDLPEDFTPVCAESDLQENVPRAVKAGDTKILLVKQSGAIHALADRCSHLGGPLHEGQIEGDTVVCPWHGSRFCLRTGAVLDGPATHPQPTLEVKRQDGQVLLRRLHGNDTSRHPRESAHP